MHRFRFILPMVLAVMATMVIRDGATAAEDGLKLTGFRLELDFHSNFINLRGFCGASILEVMRDASVELNDLCTGGRLSLDLPVASAAGTEWGIFGGVFSMAGATGETVLFYQNALRRRQVADRELYDLNLMGYAYSRLGLYGYRRLTLPLGAAGTRVDVFCSPAYYSAEVVGQGILSPGGDGTQDVAIHGAYRTRGKGADGPAGFGAAVSWETRLDFDKYGVYFQLRNLPSLVYFKETRRECGLIDGEQLGEGLPDGLAGGFSVIEPKWITLPPEASAQVVIPLNPGRIDLTVIRTGINQVLMVGYAHPLWEHAECYARIDPVMGLLNLGYRGTNTAFSLTFRRQVIGFSAILN
ncbi:MAG: hypothetical protein ACM3ZC_04850 [Bacteroidota bacterium]